YESLSLDGDACRIIRQPARLAAAGAGAGHRTHLLRPADTLYGADELQSSYRPAPLCARLHRAALSRSGHRPGLRGRHLDHGQAVAGRGLVHRDNRLYLRAAGLVEAGEMAAALHRPGALPAPDLGNLDHLRLVDV